MFRQLTAEDFQGFFQWGSRIGGVDEVDANIALGLFFSATELIRLGMTVGDIPEATGNELFRSLCRRFGAARDQAGYAAASLDTVRGLVQAGTIVSGAKGSPDELLQRLIAGRFEPVHVERNGIEHELNFGKTRDVSYRRPLELQKVPALEALLAIDAAVRDLATHNADVSPSVSSIEAAVRRIPSELFCARARAAAPRCSTLSRKSRRELRDAAARKRS